MRKALITGGIILIILIAGGTAAWYFYNQSPGEWICTDNGWVKEGEPVDAMPENSCDKLYCKGFQPDTCHEQCVVCPPCEECSSVACQTKEFCQAIGFDENWYQEMQKKISSFDECVAAGNAAMESYPRKCRAGEKEYVEEIGNELEKMDLIKIDNPRPNQIISSPLEISGQAAGNWFFEADFPVRLEDEEGNEIAVGIASAEEDWMTEEFIKYESEIKFETEAKTGWLILEKDNPSGLEENADELRVPVKFK